MKRLFIYILATIFALLFFSCKKSSQINLPPETQTGANTFGCKINGRVWIPHFACNYFANPCSEMQYSIHPTDSSGQLPIFFVFTAGNDAGNHSYFNISPFNDSSYIRGAGNVTDSIAFSFSGDLPFVTPAGTYQKYPGLGINDFEITKLDTLNKIISGTFTLTLYNGSNLNMLDSIVITEGRFDLKFGDYCKCSN